MGGCQENWISSQSGTGTLLGRDRMGVGLGLSFCIDDLPALETDGAETASADLDSGVSAVTHEPA
jgi:hypothetical protein